jgi:hypothetical protein
MSRRLRLRRKPTAGQGTLRQPNQCHERGPTVSYTSLSPNQLLMNCRFLCLCSFFFLGFPRELRENDIIGRLQSTIFWNIEFKLRILDGRRAGLISRGAEYMSFHPASSRDLQHCTNFRNERIR